MPTEHDLHLTHESEEDEMDDALARQNANQIGQLGVQLQQSGIIAQNNFITTTKAQDLDYLEGKRLVSLEEAVGVREVASKNVPAGPTSV